MLRLIRLGALLIFASSLSTTAQDVSAIGGLNQLVLEQIKKMPSGGKYAASRVATIRLQSAANFESGKFFVLPDVASPSYCSGATYLVFMKTIETLRNNGALNLDHATLEQLMIRGQRDGHGIWGRWNANGPGTARLFHELDLGPNFDDFAKAKPGDFMKIFWSPEVGKSEHGHSVVYLGTETKLGIEHVRYWSSNIPFGYGEKSVPKAKVINAIFSRLEVPKNLDRIHDVPRVDTYLAGLLANRSSFAEASAKSGM